MPATIIHRGKEIVFSESDETWACADIAFSDKSLAKVKKAIDRDAQDQRRMNVEALFLREYWRSDRETWKIQTVTITLLRDTGRSAMVKGINGKNKVEQVDLRELFPVSQRAALEAYIAAKVDEQNAERAASDAEEKLTRMTPELVRESMVQKADADT